MSEQFSAFEKFWLRSTFELHCLTGSFAGNTKRVERQASKILAMANNCDYDLLGRQPKIPRLVGIRNESRHWTAFMVVEHLSKTSDMVVQAMQGLLIDDPSKPPRQQLQHCIPDEEAGALCIDQFQDSIWHYVGVTNNLVESGRCHGSTGAIRHPVYGLLNLKKLHAWSSFHMSIHSKQIQKILATEGIV